MTAAEGLLIGAWMIVWGTVFFFVKVMLRHTWASNSLALVTP